MQVSEVVETDPGCAGFHDHSCEQAGDPLGMQRLSVGSSEHQHFVVVSGRRYLTLSQLAFPVFAQDAHQLPVEANEAAATLGLGLTKDQSVINRYEAAPDSGRFRR
jgi:hypothetical protein